jgi:hypothetical protein
LGVLVVHSLVAASPSDVVMAWHQVEVDASYVVTGRLASEMDQLGNLEVVIPVVAVDTFAEVVVQVKRQVVEVVERIAVLALELGLGLEQQPAPGLEQQQLVVEP